jgi:2-polyprenyl-3-methyl-5-hydroxy-6-metoxy-1,4-benzoquinol methylase
MSNIEEKDFLNEVSLTYFQDLEPYSRIKKDIIMDIMNEFLEKSKFKRAIQMGCANGYETEQLSYKFKSLDVVDGSSNLIEHLNSKSKLKNVKYIHSLFEEFKIRKSDEKYDYIIANYIMEHVLDSNLVLKKFAEIIKPEGHLFIVVPNANALSRRLALNMGLLEDLAELTENDKKHGHRRVYNKDSITNELIESGWQTVYSRGIIFKILADFQLNKLLKDNFLKNEHIIGLQKLADGNENFCDSIFVVARRMTND